MPTNISKYILHKKGIMNICKKCKSEFQAEYKFCPNCGHPLKLERINRQYIISEMGSLLNFEKGIFLTIKELLIRPGKSIREYISEDRTRLVKPILFILICSLTYTIFEQFFDFRAGYFDFQVEFDHSDSAVNLIFQWITNNYGYLNIIMSVFVAFWIKIFYRKYNYNYYEILIMLLFLSGIQMLLFSCFGAIESLSKIGVSSIAGNLVLIYAFWATAQFFGKRRILNYILAPISYVLGLITFLKIALGIGLLIDLII